MCVGFAGTSWFHISCVCIGCQSDVALIWLFLVVVILVAFKLVARIFVAWNLSNNTFNLLLLLLLLVAIVSIMLMNILLLLLVLVMLIFLLIRRLIIYFIKSPMVMQLIWRHQHIPINVQTIIFAGQYNTAVIHECNIKALCMFYFALQCRYQLAVLREYG